MPELPPGYRVLHMPGVATQIRDLVRSIDDEPSQRELLDKLTSIAQGLASNPSAFGEPLYNTRLPGGLVCVAYLAPVVLHYVVFEQQRVVYISDVKMSE
jgi:hypothetical protein